jgi:hypothetical protein
VDSQTNPPQGLQPPYVAYPTLLHTANSNTRAAEGHTSRAAWDPRTCNRPVHMEGMLVHGLVSSIQRDAPIRICD